MPIYQVYDKEENKLGLLKTNAPVDFMTELLETQDGDLDINDFADALDQHGFESERIFLEEFHYPL